MPAASILSEITDLLTTVVGDYGLYAVFLLMLIDAVLPAASEPVMVYGGAVAAGAFPGQEIQLFGWTLEPGFQVRDFERWRQPFQVEEARVRFVTALRQAGLPG